MRVVLSENVALSGWKDNSLKRTMETRRRTAMKMRCWYFVALGVFSARLQGKRWAMPVRNARTREGSKVEKVTARLNDEYLSCLTLLLILENQEEWRRRILGPLC
ncbi:hypothetical protein PROFUN_07621 [Planoprotostelium fungivorum]|uniref:Uncharacterized protein n=1 Tax=Planoprotostelium fungivorum TaxID=1890364 RepID=A0A2P6NK39_9EUKA|nr:hypothetical protein PROFUN_07621 [Planoprotostelium fungivorum]